MNNYNIVSNIVPSGGSSQTTTTGVVIQSLLTAGVGLQGPVGATGPTGASGSVGAVGPTGVTGGTGAPGLASLASLVDSSGGVWTLSILTTGQLVTTLTTGGGDEYGVALYGSGTYA